MPEPCLSADAIRQSLAELNRNTTTPWEIADGEPNQTLHKIFVFKDFVRAFGFMAAVALVAEGMNHHPDWSNVYKTVRVHLTTHESGGITRLDFDLAERMESLSG